MKSNLPFSESDPHYAAVLSSLKDKVLASHRRTAMAVNSRLIYLYWEIGTHIIAQQENQGWGSQVIELLSRDLSIAFPKEKGFSVRNLRYMRKFAESLPMTLIVQQAAAQLQYGKNRPILLPNAEYRGGGKLMKEEKVGKKGGKGPIVQQGAAQLGKTDYEDFFSIFELHPAAQLAWSHHMLLLDRVEEQEVRNFYMHEVIRNQWSRKMLLDQLKRKLHLLKGKLTHNFDRILSEELTVQAVAAFQDPYFLDFIPQEGKMNERVIHEKLLHKMKDFLLQLGSGFAFVGSQVRVEVGGQAYFIDLQFYHTVLRCFVLLELKWGELMPEHVGKMLFYLSTMDDFQRPGDNPAIGLILTRKANRIIAEYALRYAGLPIGISEYRFSSELPDEMKPYFPSQAQINHALSGLENQVDFEAAD